MRLEVLDHGHRLRTKLLFGLIRVMSRHRAPDVIRLLTYRPDFFGTAINDVFHEALRGPSEWSVGERELMAAFVSKTNECEF
ncbi:MAG TPA: hypothetical protein VGL61_33285 [Kofleriaceae bacterium]|jgi:hypothetical protein